MATQKIKTEILKYQKKLNSISDEYKSVPISYKKALLKAEYEQLNRELKSKIDDFECNSNSPQDEIFLQKALKIYRQHNLILNESKKFGQSILQFKEAKRQKKETTNAIFTILGKIIEVFLWIFAVLIIASEMDTKKRR